MRLIILIIILLAFGACKKHVPGGPYYFSTWDGYDLPRRPVDPITPEEAKSRKAYIEVFYDDRGRISRITKYLGGNLEWSDSYEYDGNALVRRIGTKPSGEVVEDRYDR
jgi:Family of unknown function (DUF6156)